MTDLKVRLAGATLPGLFAVTLAGGILLFTFPLDELSRTNLSIVVPVLGASFLLLSLYYLYHSGYLGVKIDG